MYANYCQPLWEMHTMNKPMLCIRLIGRMVYTVGGHTGGVCDWQVDFVYTIHSKLGDACVWESCKKMYAAGGHAG